VQWEQPDVGTVRSVGIPVKFQVTPGKINRPAPAIGEHTIEILSLFGVYTEEEVGALQNQGAVWSAGPPKTKTAAE
jgi:crotonobetainyl-CoA:carnitine CoA-transferase CaiB-like acyl-CoA transferase